MLQALDLVKCYPGGERPAVDHLSLELREGEFLSIVGRSGSGKSTLLHLLSSLIKPDSGEVLFHGENIHTLPEKKRNRLRSEVFAVVFQQHHLLPYLTSMENVLLPCMDGFTPVSAVQTEAARAALERLEMADKAGIKPNSLSGGEQQRVAIARALARGARVLFADEPTGSLDSATGASIMRILHSLNRDGLSIIMVTHNEEFAGRTDRLIRMVDGRILDRAAV